jgi:putative nuclease YbcO-like protein
VPTNRLSWTLRTLPERGPLQDAYDGTVVAAHCNDVEFKGIGRKSHDCLVAYLCMACHDRTDGRTGGLTLTEKRAMWDRSFKRTVVRWFQQGIVKVQPKGVAQ